MRITCFLAAALFAGPAAAAPGLTSGMSTAPMFGPMRGVEWRLVRIGDATVAAAPPVTLLLNQQNNAAGSTGCNSYQAAFRMSAGRISFPAPPVATQIGCDPALAERERAFLARLAQGGRAEVRLGRTLRIRAADQPDLIFEKAATPLP